MQRAGRPDGTPYIEIQVRRNIKNRDAIYRRRGGSAPTSSRIVLHNSAINLHPRTIYFAKQGLASLYPSDDQQPAGNRNMFTGDRKFPGKSLCPLARRRRINPMNINYNLHDINRHYQDSWPKFVDVHWLQRGRYAKRGLKRVERRARVALRTGGPDLRIALNGTDRGSRLMVLGRLEAETEDDFVRVEFWQVVERLLGRVMIGGCLLESRNAR